jgi:hypothetical protein
LVGGAHLLLAANLFIFASLYLELAYKPPNITGLDVSTGFAILLTFKLFALSHSIGAN